MMPEHKRKPRLETQRENTTSNPCDKKKGTFKYDLDKVRNSRAIATTRRWKTKTIQFFKVRMCFGTRLVFEIDFGIPKLENVRQGSETCAGFNCSRPSPYSRVWMPCSALKS